MGNIFNGKEKALVAAVLMFFVSLIQQILLGGPIEVDPDQINTIGSLVSEMTVSAILSVVTYAGTYIIPNTNYEKVEKPVAYTKTEAEGYKDPEEFPEVEL